MKVSKDRNSIPASRGRQDLVCKYYMYYVKMRLFLKSEGH